MGVYYENSTVFWDTFNSLPDIVHNNRGCASSKIALLGFSCLFVCPTNDDGNCAGTGIIHVICASKFASRFQNPDNVTQCIFATANVKGDQNISDKDMEDVNVNVNTLLDKIEDGDAKEKIKEMINGRKDKEYFTTEGDSMGLPGFSEKKLEKIPIEDDPRPPTKNFNVVEYGNDAMIQKLSDWADQGGAIHKLIKGSPDLFNNKESGFVKSQVRYVRTLHCIQKIAYLLKKKEKTGKKFVVEYAIGGIWIGGKIGSPTSIKKEECHGKLECIDFVGNTHSRNCMPIVCHSFNGENECIGIIFNRGCVWDREVGKCKCLSDGGCKDFRQACKLYDDNEEKCKSEIECFVEERKCIHVGDGCKTRKNEDECKESGSVGGRDGLTKCVWEVNWNPEEHKYKAECRPVKGSCKSAAKWNECEVDSKGLPCIWNAFKKEPDCVPLHDFCHQLGSSSPFACESIWDCVWEYNQCTTSEPSKWTG